MENSKTAIEQKKVLENTEYHLQVPNLIWCHGKHQLEENYDTDQFLLHAQEELNTTKQQRKKTIQKETSI